MKHTEITWTKATPQEAAGNALEHMKDLLEGLERGFSTLKVKGTSRQEAEQFRQALAQARQEAAQETGSPEKMKEWVAVVNGLSSSVLRDDAFREAVETTAASVPV